MANYRKPTAALTSAVLFLASAAPGWDAAAQTVARPVVSGTAGAPSVAPLNTSIGGSGVFAPVSSPVGLQRGLPGIETVALIGRPVERNDR